MEKLTKYQIESIARVIIADVKKTRDEKQKAEKKRVDEQRLKQPFLLKLASLLGEDPDNVRNWEYNARQLVDKYVYDVLPYPYEVSLPSWDAVAHRLNAEAAFNGGNFAKAREVVEAQLKTELGLI